ncbi:ComF family protein [Reichenbachiella ulvae]|uniref:Phosphoribosyltransferase family protein n=1 Tax=Reichenbachiella ulvae TaxID=2980104 RepID=A0ABT3CXK3_9BACT|nr:phosphoribosyltransferase family protein [Reichenbachiella ulvae]MCV9388334.1 phosphoribosyltransferase family protein [Reichenbachiella ulvae]
MKIKHYWNGFVSLVFPQTCLKCSRPMVDGEELLCLHCHLDLPKTNYHQLELNPLYSFLSGSLEIEQAFAFLKYDKNGIAQKLIHQLKYGGNKEVGFTLGRWMARDIKFHVEEKSIDFIVPVPLHFARKLKRGYNQSLEIAKGMSEVLGIPIKDDVIKRISMKGSQAKKGRIDRLSNKHKEYLLVNPELLKDKSVLLLDDVITTGATISTIGQILLDAGVSNLSVACLATGK